jgi:hypothetical protein
LIHALCRLSNHCSSQRRVHHFAKGISGTANSARNLLSSSENNQLIVWGGGAGLLAPSQGQLLCLQQLVVPVQQANVQLLEVKA